MKQWIAALMTLAAAAEPAFAAEAAAGPNTPAPPRDARPPAGDALTEAVVRQVDLATGMITLKHGALDNVGMPPMTMTFKAKDIAMAKRVRAGDSVRVRVENVDGVMTVVKLEK
ncbi:copper binding periplasmic CusF family protein [Burkholderia pseudomallei MSHR7500]|uniref:copper-binding protein n=1 Tax=Burkholderia pseudomallei TaxID=28450 RepID=UPI0005310EEC|nr:copper-binding protein [Burkholderia pseudomallei]KGS84227.1 copper binding periplasmic CusF family protein [Burkholderia pseudomallei MSHR7500]